MDEKQRNENIERSFAGQIVSFGVIQVIIRFRGLITLPILTRLIGIEGYGNLAPLGALSSILQLLIVLGVKNSINVFIPGIEKEDRRREFWGLVQITAIMGLLVSIFLLGFFPVIKSTLLSPETTTILFLAAVLAIPLSSLQSVLQAQIVNHRDGRVYSRIIAIVTLIEIVLIIVGAYFYRETGVLYATTISSFILVLIMLALLNQRDAFAPISKAVMPDLTKYYTYGMTLVIVGFASWVVSSSDRFFLVQLAGIEQAGIYDVLYKISSQLNFLAAPIFTSLLPFIAEAVNVGDEKTALKYMDQANKLLIFIFVPGVVLYSLTSRDLLAVLATADFAASAHIVPYLAVAIGLWQLVGVYNYNIHAHKRARVMVISMVAAAVVNISINVIFIPIYGINAAAISTLAAYAVIFLLNRHFSNQSLLVRYDLGYVLRVGVAVIAMSLVALVAQNVFATSSHLIRFLASAGAGGVVYLATIYFLDAFTTEERKRIWTVFRSVLFSRKSA
ncbi:MAG: hypothetical protein DWQ07_09045 [Chloroflexi bacterium]|nr:MAG: hypothetical protein DWQ07_09045 [Chloroflexota bacterium]MBL1193141.1 hypothetical protein [Chloroflexota bacterium]NOH10434.1 oligosaccharide flippase family protein [Chloroflexota bacterium]